MSDLGDWVRFMGTAGARFVVSRQLRSSAGLWCSLQGQNILIDPGPGTLCRCFSCRPPLDPEKLDAIILTHRHLDHSTDINVLIEAMTQGTFNHRGSLFAPVDAVDSDEPVVFRHTRRSVERLELLQAGGCYRINGVEFITPVRHHHPVETYGIIFNLPYGKVSLVSDTLYFPELADHYAGSDILILNVVLHRPPPVRWIQHLDLESASSLIQSIRPRLAVLTHFGMTMLNRDPDSLAGHLTGETGVQVIAASDGLKLALESYF
ncbi:MAG: MBL fold metallo-hydrolase [Firmicutes bacterium]|nr:MBL fold metallo-hydrolase [Bacillota bacterium]